MREREPAFMRPRVWSLREQVRTRKSDSVRSSSTRSGVTTLSAGPSAVAGLRLVARTVMSNALAIFATRDPIAPIPTMPMVLPASSSSRLGISEIMPRQKWSRWCLAPDLR